MNSVYTEIGRRVFSETLPEDDLGIPSWEPCEMWQLGEN